MISIVVDFEWKPTLIVLQIENKFLPNPSKNSCPQHVSSGLWSARRQVFWREILLFGALAVFFLFLFWYFCTPLIKDVMSSPEEKMQEKRKETKITHTKWDAEHFLMENSLVSQCVCTQHSISFSLDICSPRVQHLVRSLMFWTKLSAALRISNI